MLRLRVRYAIRPRAFSNTIVRLTQTGYGDPQDERIDNYTPTPKGGSAGKPSSSVDPQPDGQGTGAGQQSSTTDPEVKPKETTNAGGDTGMGGDEGQIPEKQTKQTKKIGEDAKDEEVGGAGPIGG